MARSDQDRTSRKHARVLPGDAIFWPDMSATSIHSSTRTSVDGSVATHGTGGMTRNKILALLPPAELEDVLARTEMLTIQSKEIIFEREQPIRFVHFPEDGVISLVTELEDGDQVEAMTVGNDGFVGLAIFHGIPSSSLKATVQITGRSRSIAGEDFRKLAAECSGLNRLLHRYSQFVFETV